MSIFKYITDENEIKSGVKGLYKEAKTKRIKFRDIFNLFKNKIKKNKR
jgi:hypothetical protein